MNTTMTSTHLFLNDIVNSTLVCLTTTLVLDPHPVGRGTLHSDEDLIAFGFGF